MKLSFIYRYSLISFVIILCVTAITQPVRAYTNAVPSLPAAPGHVTIIVLDMSGSMGTNDPLGLRCSAAKAYIDLSGVGDVIGLIGLDNSDNSTDARGFQSAQVWAQPIEMSTLPSRQGLQQIIDQRSHHCKPDNTTPTYDALNLTLQMLQSATNNGQISGSVILLTDGIPDPNSDAQVNAINTTLLPQFQQHDWPVDTVALGADSSFHQFLSNISNATSGKFYDDGKGAIAGVSPLNIAPFFVDIFARRNGRTLGPSVEPTSLNGGTTARDFQLGNYVDHLDVVVVKDRPATTVTLQTSSGLTLPPAVPGTFVSAGDPYYAIFSINGPQMGDWLVKVSGAGLFLMDSLVVSALKVSIQTPTSRPALPLGQEFTISATINNHGTPVSGGQFTVTGNIIYVGEPPVGTVAYSKDLVLTDNASPGTYQAKLTVPENASPGAYDITVSVSQVSSTPISSDQRTIRLERFPVPLFLSPQTGRPTDGTVSTAVTRWDPVLQFIYSLPIGFFRWLSQWPLGNLPAQPATDLSGWVQLDGQLYRNATVTATASRAGLRGAIPVTVLNDGNGRFHLQFVPPTDGAYAITFKTSGSFKDSHGDFGTTTRHVNVIIQGASIWPQETIAWGWTAGYLFVLYLIFRFFVFLFTPGLFGEWARIEDGDITARHDFNQSRRSPIEGFFHRNLLSSRDAGLPTGLQFRFRRGDSIEARLDGPANAYWRRGDGRELGNQFQEIRELRYDPGQDEEDSELSSYIIIPRQRREFTFEEDD